MSLDFDGPLQLKEEEMKKFKPIVARMNDESSSQKEEQEKMMNKIKVVGVFVLGLIFGLTQFSMAQEEEPFKLEGMVITTTKKKVKVLTTPASITIITAEDIKESGYRSTPELIGSLPSIHDESINDSYYFNFRGTKSSDSHGPHILIDGREVNLGMFGFNIIGSIPLENIERVEVIRTPGAYISGRDSARGVINIITKKGEKEEKAFSPELSFSYGSWETKTESLSVSGNKEKIDYYLNVWHKDSEGYRHSSPDYRAVLGKLGYDWTDTLRLGFDVQYNKEDRRYTHGLKQWQLDEGYRRSAEIPSSQTSSAYMQKQNTVENEVVAGTISLDYDNYPYRGGVSLNLADYEDKYEQHQYDNSSSMRPWTYNVDRTQDICDIKLFGGRTFEMASDVTDSVEIGYDNSRRDAGQKKKYPYQDYPTGEKRGTADFKERYHGFFVNNELNRGKFGLGTGLRYELSDYDLTTQKPDQMSKDYKKLAWNIAPSYMLFPEGNLYFNVSCSYFYPTASYFFYAMDYGGDVNKAGDLTPEETTCYEIGFKHHYADWLSYSANLFHMKLKDRFLSLYDDAGNWKGWSNVGDSTNQGIELEGEGRPLDWLGYNLSFSYIDAEWDSGSNPVYEHGDTPADDVQKNTNLSGKKVIHIPEFQARLGLTFYPPVNGLKFNVGISEMGEQYIDLWNRYKKDAVCLVDTRLTYERKNWEFYVSGQNIFDKKHEKIWNSGSRRNSDGTPDHSYYPKNGRYVEAGLSVRF